MRRTAAVVLLALSACNQAPTLSSVVIGPESPTTLDALMLDIGEVVDPNGSQTLDVSISWAVNGQTVPTLDGAFSVPAALTAAGDVWSAKVVATDGDMESLPWTTSVRIGNTAPVASISLNPADPQPGEPITASITTSDVDDDDVSVTWHWQRDGRPVDIVGPEIPAGWTLKGERWTVSAVPNDGSQSGEPVIHDILIGNSAPVVHRATLLSDTGRTDSPLLVSTSSADADGDGIQFRYSWLVDGQPIDNDSPVLPASAFHRDQRVDVWVVATDGQAQSDAVRASIVIANSPPSLTQARLSASSAGALDTLSCLHEDGFDADGDDLYYLYYWQVNGELRGRADTFSGGFERDDSVACVVLVADGTDSGEPVSSAPLVIGNTAPFAQGIQLDSGMLTATSQASVTPYGAIDPDGDSISYHYAWSVNGALVSTETKLSPSAFAKGATVSVVVTPTDGVDDGIPMTGSWTVENSTPQLTNVRLDGDNVEGGTLTALASASDPDGEALDRTFEWRVNGVVVPNATDSITGELFDRGDFVSALITVTDADGASISAQAGPFIIRNAEPTIASVTIDQAEARSTETLTVTLGEMQDADGDTLETTISWLVDGVVAATGDTFVVPEAPAGTRLYARVDLSDGAGGTDTAYSEPLTIHNGSPVLSSVAILPDSGITRDTVLLANWSGSDPEGEPLDATYQWTINGSPISADTVSIPVWLWAGKGDTIGLSVVVTDGGSASEPLSATSVTVGNSAPNTPNISFASVDIDPSTDLKCALATETIDPDGDVVSHTFTWLRDGEQYDGIVTDTDHPGDTIPAAQVGLAESWECGAVASDGEDDSGADYTSGDVNHGSSAVGGRHIVGDTAIFRLGPVDLVGLTSADDYAAACNDEGLAPVSCDASVYGSDSDASVWGAIELDSSIFGCDVSAGVATETGWSNLVSLHEPLLDVDGYCIEGCAPAPSEAWLLCAAALD